MTRHPPRLFPLLTILLICAAAPATATAAPDDASDSTAGRFEKSDLFIPNAAAYPVYRIPGIVVTPRGTLLAYCEGRSGKSGDWGKIDVVLRRSTDGGRTWSADQNLSAAVRVPVAKNPAALAKRAYAADEITYNNPVAIVDAQTGTVHVLFCAEYMRCFYRRSDDDGKTFSDPIEIIAAFEKFRGTYDWKVLATGPAHGIRLKSGRLVVPVWLSSARGGNAHHPSVVATIYSDDAGRTWRPGDIVANETDPLRDPNESAIAQLADGRVMLNIRSESKQNRRAVATSPDGATNWTRPTFDDALAEPVCMASICRLSARPTFDRNRLLFCNPDNLDRADGKAKPGGGRDRKNLTVRLSYDEGESWPVAKPIEPGQSAYSDLAVGPDGTIYCLYERGQGLVLARFDLQWLTNGKDHLRTIPEP